MVLGIDWWYFESIVCWLLLLKYEVGNHMFPSLSRSEDAPWRYGYYHWWIAPLLMSNPGDNLLSSTLPRVWGLASDSRLIILSLLFYWPKSVALHRKGVIGYGNCENVLNECVGMSAYVIISFGVCHKMTISK